MADGGSGLNMSGPLNLDTMFPIPKGWDSSQGFPVVLCTSAPLRRDRKTDEVWTLDFGRGAVHLGAEIALTWEHDREKIIGVVRDLALGEKEISGTAYFLKTTLARRIRADIKSGRLGCVSLGYLCSNVTGSTKDGWRVGKWQPIELAVCVEGVDPNATIRPSPKPIHARGAQMDGGTEGANSNAFGDSIPSLAASSVNQGRSYTSTASASGSIAAATHINITTNDYAFNSAIFCTSLFQDLTLETSDNSPGIAGAFGLFNPGGAARNWEIRWRAFNT